ncbi:hypothetical protein PR048_033135 [Dryococelus australis]|uniref:PH domain-containing protein n=1 Tax=Dryococelus australis TaxID=614101 RepID=A0ABQ9FZD3_9NEOP|nr:hypothetical protein PR048_033135 [Dryococelus australis]
MAVEQMSTYIVATSVHCIQDVAVLHLNTSGKHSSHREEEKVLYEYNCNVIETSSPPYLDVKICPNHFTHSCMFIEIGLDLWFQRWRKRWFVLRHSGELPGQYFLEYYTDHNCRKLKGKIDLDQCEQVDAGLRFENSKQKYQHMFDVKTPKRIYYLAAESEDDMNKWVEYVCHVCGLKAYKEDEENGEIQPAVSEPLVSQSESPPTSPVSSISGPYIPISECISGMPLSSPDGLEDFNKRVANGMPSLPAKHTAQLTSVRAEFYDAPRKLQPPAQSPSVVDTESVFADDEWTAPVPVVNWETFPAAATDDLGSWSVKRRFGRLTIVDSTVPPRPPKPQHLGSEPPSPSPATDETYDFPRCHPPPAPTHCYSNATPTPGGKVFCYEFSDGDPPPPSPLSETSSTGNAVYSNLPSPHAPAVDRGLKPGFAPPNVDRKLKPQRKLGSSTVMPDYSLIQAPGSLCLKNHSKWPPGELKLWCSVGAKFKNNTRINTILRITIRTQHFKKTIYNYLHSHNLTTGRLRTPCEEKSSNQSRQSYWTIRFTGTITFNITGLESRYSRKDSKRRRKLRGS